MHNKNEKHKIYYVCEGECGAKLTEEEAKKIGYKCGDKNCSHHGKPFVMKEWCEHCGKFCEG